MIVINKTSNRDTALNTESLKGVTFNRENKGHKFVISCMRGGVLEPVSGTITGYFMRSNNTTCRVEGTGFTGVDVDGRAWIILPQDCYNVAGRFKLSIYVLHNGTSECIYSCIGTVERSDVGEVIDSGVPLPTYDDIADKYNEMETARQACIDAAESIDDLKSAFDDSVLTFENFAEAEWEDGALSAQGGGTNSSSGYIRTKEFFPADDYDAIKSQNGVTFLIFAYSQANVNSFLGWWNGSTLVNATGSLPYYAAGRYIAPIRSAGATYIRICARLANGTIAVSDGDNVLKGYNRIDAIEADVSGAVHYSEAQNLTTAQKTQARNNIEAASVDDVDDLEDTVNDSIIRVDNFSSSDWTAGTVNSQTGGNSPASGYIRTTHLPIDSTLKIVSSDGCKFIIFAYSYANSEYTYLGWLKDGELVKTYGTADYYTTDQSLTPYESAGATHFRLSAVLESGTISVSDGTKVSKGINRIEEIKTTTVRFDAAQTLTDAQKLQARDNIDAASADDLDSLTDAVNDSILRVDNFSASEWEDGALHAQTGQPNSSSGYIRTKQYISVDSVIKIASRDGVVFLPFCYTYTNGAYTFLGWWNGSTFVAASGSSPYYTNSQYTDPIKTAGATYIRICAKLSSGTIAVSDATKVSKSIDRISAIEDEIDNVSIKDGTLSDLVEAQKAIADDWHFAFINVYGGMGLGANHLIPGTKNLWSQSVTKDLDQQHVWMQDGIHPFKGAGVTDMYARTIAPQLAMVVPSYRDGVGLTTPSVWSGRNVLWMGTSIPKGSDPDAGEGQGATYPELVCGILGATAINIARGSSCLRINASTGTYDQMLFAHLLRAVTRTVDECDLLAANWSNIDKTKIVNATETLSASDVTTMKNHSFENLLLPYLDGTNSMPDLFVIDYGHNDVRPRGVDGENDLWIEPSLELINSGVLAEDTYMTANSYANLKTTLNNDLSGITDKAGFAASLNRNCFKGAVNFLITLILSYNPYARFAIVSDYN